MKTFNVSRVIQLLLLAAIVTVYSQGNLTPPGAPAPTMKTLTEIEPRTAISSLPFTISTPGSYYLTGNLSATTTGITVTARDVTIDLNGFTLTGDSAHDGISASAAVANLCVRNGTLKSWASGINAAITTGGTFTNLRLTNNSAGGISAGIRASVLDCVANNNNGATGIFTFDQSLVSRCVADANASGIVVATNSAIMHCVASNNTGTGISADSGTTVSDCTSVGNGTGTAGNGITVNASSTVRNCTVSGNKADGIQATQNNNVIVGNMCDSNNPSNTSNQAGIIINGAGNKIDSNNISNNGFAGVVIFGGTANKGNIMVRNTFSGAQYILNSSFNTVGPPVDMSVSGGQITNTNPWANIMY